VIPITALVDFNPRASPGAGRPTLDCLSRRTDGVSLSE